MIARRNAFAATLAALSLVATEAAAQSSNAAASPWMALVEVGPVWHHDASHQSFLPSRTAPPTVGLSFGRDIAPIGPALTVAIDAMWRIENTSGRVRQRFDTQLVTHRLQGGVTLRLSAVRWLTPYARLSVGAAHYNARVKGTEGGELVSEAWTPFGSLGAGLMLTTGRWFEGIGWHRGRVVVLVEGGYEWALPVTLTAAPPTPDDPQAAADRIASGGVALGTLNPSAAYLRFGVGFRF